MSETIINNMARGWNRAPAGAAESSNQSSVSAALWSHDSDDVQEVWADPDPHRHIISVMQNSFYHAIVHKDDKHVFSTEIQKGGVQLMQAGVRPRAVHRGRWRILHFYVPAAALNALAIEENLTTSPGMLELIDPQCGFDPVIARLGCEVIAEMQDQAPLSRLRIDLLGQELAIRLIRQWSNLPAYQLQAARSGTPALTSWQLKQAKDLMMSGLGEDRALAEIAAAARLSPFHFARAFKASTGLPPHRYLILQRLERARDLLETTNLPVTEIAAQVGYDDPGYLARLFRAHFGKTPANYRRERRS